MEGGSADGGGGGGGRRGVEQLAATIVSVQQMRKDLWCSTRTWIKGWDAPVDACLLDVTIGEEDCL